MDPKPGNPLDVARKIVVLAESYAKELSEAPKESQRTQFLERRLYRALAELWGDPVTKEEAGDVIIRAVARASEFDEKMRVDLGEKWDDAEARRERAKHWWPAVAPMITGFSVDLLEKVVAVDRASGVVGESFLVAVREHSRKGIKGQPAPQFDPKWSAISALLLAVGEGAGARAAKKRQGRRKARKI